MDKETIDTVLSAIKAPVVLDGLSAGYKFALVPQGMEAIDLRGYLGPRPHIAQYVEALAVETFCGYLARYGNECTVIFANEPQAKYEAVLDYHPKLAGKMPADRGECVHVVNYCCPQSDQWKSWNAMNNKLIGQEEFATFIETNLRDIHEPAGADMLQVALNLQVRKSAQFESGIRLDNGQVQFRYTEQIKGTAGGQNAGDLRIPTEFKLRVPVFVDGAVWVQPARFKYRMSEGKLYLGYELLRPLEVYAQAVKQVTADIAKSAASSPLYLGTRRA